MVVLLKILQVIAALSLLVIVHEFGHYSFAKLFKTRVEKFYLFFNPKISIVKFKKFNGRLHCKFFSSNEDEEWDKHPEQTEYGIGWVPLGGYCKISGMIDESMDKEALKLPPQPYEFRTKPAWQRFFIMFGGVFFNFILAGLLYAAILNTWGEEYLRNEDAVYGIAVNDLAAEIGFRTGDRILSQFRRRPDRGFLKSPDRPRPLKGDRSARTPRRGHCQHQHRPCLYPCDAQLAGNVQPRLPVRSEGVPRRVA